MSGRTSRLLVLAFVALLGAGLVVAQTTVPVAPNERHVKPEVNVQDGNASRNAKLWVLDFKFKPLRSIKVTVPGRGEQICYYLWYQVINKTAKPQLFVPNFELVTHDTRKVYRDEILPTVLDAIADLEDPSGVLKIKSSNSITRDPIPASRPNAIPRAITGVAIFTDPNEPLPRDSAEVKQEKAKQPKLSDSNFFSLFIAGLSNGWAETESISDSTKTVVRRKTLQLKFRRFGDGALRRDEDLRYTGHEWLYRASSLEIPKDKPKGGTKPDDKPPMMR